MDEEVGSTLVCLKFDLTTEWTRGLQTGNLCFLSGFLVGFGVWGFRV